MGKRRKRKKGKEGAAPVEARAYEAAFSTPQRRHVIGAQSSQDAAADEALQRVRNWGRYLDENHDLAVGILDELCKNVVGAGIQTIPKPLTEAGEVDERLATEIMRAWKTWQRRADISGELTWHAAQRLICRAWFRDGEHFIQHVQGRMRGYPFARSETPYRIELIESEMCPWDSNQDGVRQGIVHDTWRRPLAYLMYLEHPDDIVTAMRRPNRQFETKTVPAEQITHIKNTQRWPATRGMSVFASVISRLYDVKDLEESERIKNRILASWCAAIIKAPELIGQENTDSEGRRFLEMAGGTVIDTLAAGESIVGVGPDYPVANMPDHIADQMRRVASGTGTRYSSIAKRYDGNYSSQRQEMVESEGHYGVREDAFVSKVCRTVYERWLQSAILDGKVMVSPSADFELVSNAEHRGPVTPWIDPWREAQADKLAVDEAFITREQVQIKRGMDATKIGTEPERPAAPPAQPDMFEQEDEESEAA